jgi:TolB-like protein/tetratricopeptide (TPR) repeat protein
MRVDDPSPGTHAYAEPFEERLDSWKEIAAYLKRDVTTAQRWEKREGMPVYRHVHEKRGSVYAFGSELDAWLARRGATLENGSPGEQAAAPEKTPAHRAGVQPFAVRVRRWVALGGLAVVAAVAIAYGVAPRRGADAASQRINSLAVLPLRNLSGDPAQEYLAEGMTEALIAKLSGIHNLRVISHTSVERFRSTENAQMGVPEIAKTLHVDAIVEGSVIRQGNRVRVTAQLIRGATDEHFWAQTYDRELPDVLALQSEVAQSIADRVEVTITGGEHERLAASRRVAPEVYDSYLQGVFASSRSYTRADIQKSIDYFNAAIKQDPTFAPAYLGLADSYDSLGSNFVGDKPDVALEKVIANAQEAVQLDPTLAAAHETLAGGLQQEWQWTQAKLEYQHALELNPNDPDAYLGMAHWLLCEGQADEALDWERRARELDPAGLDATDIGWMLLEARHYDEAVHELREGLAVAGEAEQPVALWDLGIALTVISQPADAVPFLEKAVSLSNHSPGVTGSLIAAYARAGRRKDALRLLAELQTWTKTGYVPAAAFVRAYIGLGDREQAFVWLSQAYKEHSNTLQYLKVAPEFDSLRDDPRFAELLHRVGLDQNL